jgi:hypothetical protein
MANHFTQKGALDLCLYTLYNRGEARRTQMTMPRDTTPPEPTILGHRFRVIDYAQDKIVMLWDVGDILNPKKTPEVWCGMEYWTLEGRQDAKRRLGFICGLLNGIRQPGEVIDQK